MLLLQFIVEYRLDLAVAVLAAAGGALAYRRRIRRRYPHENLPLEATQLLLALVILGGLAAEWTAFQRRKSLVAMISGVSPTYAYELQKLGHERLNLDTPPDDPTYLEIIQHEKDWLKANPGIADVYTFRKDADGKIRFIADSETDYDHNGVFEGDRESRTEIGEVYDEASPLLVRALDGETVFDTKITTDRWGSWVSSYAPIYDESGKVDAAVGNDFPAATWIATIAADRAVTLVIAGLLGFLVLWRTSASTLIRAERREREKTAERLAHEKRAAEIAVRAKNEIVGVLSHEIRTPLNAVVGYSDALSETSLSLQQRRYTEIVIGAADRLVVLLDEILNISDTSETKLRISLTENSPAMIVHEVLHILSATAEEKKITLCFEDQLGTSMMLAVDPLRIRQVLLNLVGNAIKYTEHGSVTVRAMWTPAGGESCDGRLVLAVSDTGIGIAPERLTTLFHPASRAVLNGSARESAGLGLAVCRRVVEAMSGTIDAQSVAGSGSTFTFSVPCKRVDAVDARRTSADGFARDGGERPRILVADDNPVNRQMLKVLLRRCGYETDLAAGGLAAVELAAQNSYGAIITDLDMPDLDGYGAAIRIRQNEVPGRRVPIIALTAATERGTRERCIAAGMDDYLTKPVYFPALKATLEALLEPLVSV